MPASCALLHSEVAGMFLANDMQHTLPRLNALLALRETRSAAVTSVS